VSYFMAVLGGAVVMWACFLGCGLALERVLPGRVRLANALLLAVGMCVAMVLVFPGYVAGVGDVLAVALLVAVTLAGFVFARGGLRARVNPGWAGAAGLAAYLLYMLPVIASGHWTWSGYDFVGDSAFEMLLAVHIKGFGTVLGSIPETSEREFLRAYLGTGYPLGTQSLLGTFSGLTHTPVEVLYQGFISALAALAAVALATLTSGLLRAWRAAVVGFAAIAANLTYQYALQGGIKELGLLATVCTAAALAHAAVSSRESARPDSPAAGSASLPPSPAASRGAGPSPKTTPIGPYAAAILLAVVAAAALAAYNAVAVPYLAGLVACLAVFLVAVQRIRPSRAWIGPVALGGGLTALLAIPSLSTFQTFFSVASSGQGSTGVGATQFGQLLRALPLSQISGVWLAGEYRLPVSGQAAAHLTKLATVAIFALLVPGIAWALRRRSAGPLLLLGTTALVLAAALPRVSPYGQGKLLAMAGPAVVLMALVPLAVVRGRFAPLALAAGGLLSLAVGASDILAYSYDRVAPTARMEAIRQVGHRFAGEGLVEWNEFDEYAKVLANPALISAPFEALTPAQVQLRSPTYFYGHYFDLDQELLSFVERYPVIVTRRSPAASRPPANYRRVYENAYYVGWRRTSRPVVLDHLPEQQIYSPSEKVACPALRAFVAGAPAGSQLLLATAPELAWFNPTADPTRSGGWGPNPEQAGSVLTPVAGHTQGGVHVRGGRYAVWVQGDFPRPVQVFVDGRSVGWVSGSETPGQWLQAATLTLAPGAHTLRLYKHRGRLHLGPGESAVGTLGGAALQGQEPERLRTFPVSSWRKLCGTLADWVELVRP
jgi:hypothetical protein